MSASEQEELLGWWRGFAQSGELPSCFERVQGRLIRAVHRAPLAGGEVFVKTMTFPRAKDRLRYLFRALPAQHEAAMLRATAAAGVPCPEVVAAFRGRRLGLPHRSMLVLRALPVVDEVEPDAAACVADEVAVAMRLLAAGIHHDDLHEENFVRLQSGELAVLDLQSAQQYEPGSDNAGGRRMAVATRMLRDREGPEQDAAIAAMRAHGMLCSEAEVAHALRVSDRLRARYNRSRVHRCLRTSTEFARRLTLSGVRYERRGRDPGGRWLRGGAALRDAWLGQRVRQLRGAATQPFGAYFRKWWWLGGGSALYVSRQCSDAEIEVEVQEAAAAARAWRDEAPA